MTGKRKYNLDGRAGPPLLAKFAEPGNEMSFDVWLAVKAWGSGEQDVLVWLA